ncbi:MAG: prohibitin family protein [Chloroflexi bacterium]|nr:prohibitin family protein [Chloroflexota bacterium]
MTENKKIPSKIWLYVFAGCAGIVVAVLCVGALLISVSRQWFIFIEPDERGVVLSLNQPTGEVLEPGYHFVSPDKQVIIYKISHQTYVMSANPNGEADFIESITKDGQKIQIDISVIYAVDPERLPELFKTWGETYRDNVVRPMSRSVTRNTLRDFTYDEVIKKHDEIEKNISNELEKSLSETFLILVKFELLDIRLAP